MSHNSLNDAALPPLLTVAEAARALRVSDETIRRRCADGTLRSVQLGSVRRIPASELERLAAAAEGNS